MLKESEQLDELVPDLLLNMGIRPLGRAQVGVRQHGVDVSGVGPDPEDNVEKLFLITIKSGDLDRKTWDGDTNAIRPTLNQIQDSYLHGRVDEKYADIPAKIVVCAGGELKQSVKSDWVGYKKNNVREARKWTDLIPFADRFYRNKSKRVRELDFAFWGADKLAQLMDEHFLDEFLFPESAQKQLRKTIALADQNEGEPTYFYSFVEDTLFERDIPTGESATDQRERKRIFRLLNLSASIVYHWCRDADNLRPAVFCSERILLRVWDWMRKNDLLEKDAAVGEYLRLFRTHSKILGAYSAKLQPNCYVEDGLFQAGPSDRIEYPLRTFEAIGIIAESILIQTFFLPHVQDEEIGETLAEQASACGHALASLLENNPSSRTPLYDSHVIDITLAVLALRVTGFEQEAKRWIAELGPCVIFAYRIGQNFPIWTDSFEDLVALNYENSESKKELTEISTLLPILAEWYGVFGMKEEYHSFRLGAEEAFEHSNFQIWYPDEATDEELYQRNAGFRSGNTLPSISLPESLQKLREKVQQAREKSSAPDSISCIQQGFSVLALISSRHYRTPVLPMFWENLLLENAESESAEAVEASAQDHNHPESD
jgi:hypothetical protein